MQSPRVGHLFHHGIHLALRFVESEFVLEEEARSESCGLERRPVRHGGNGGHPDDCPEDGNDKAAAARSIVDPILQRPPGIAQPPPASRHFHTEVVAKDSLESRPGRQPLSNRRNPQTKPHREGLQRRNLRSDRGPNQLIVEVIHEDNRRVRTEKSPFSRKPRSVFFGQQALAATTFPGGLRTLLCWASALDNGRCDDRLTLYAGSAGPRSSVWEPERGRTGMMRPGSSCSLRRRALLLGAGSILAIREPAAKDPITLSAARRHCAADFGGA